MARAEQAVDPLELVGLLWRDPLPSARSGISTRNLTGLAIKIADREGLDAVTIRHLAQEAGVTAMALYPHIGGRSQLVELMLDAHAGQVYADGELPAALPDWHEAVRFVAQRNYDAAITHPWILHVPALRPVPGPGVTSKYEHELAALDSIGLSDVQMDHALTAVLGLAHAAAQAQTGLARARADTGRSDLEWWQQVGPALAAAMRGREYPLAERVGTAAGLAANSPADPVAALDYSVGLLLSGLDLTLSTNRTTRELLAQAPEDQD
ncbi:MAG: TetR/AcrR family transcriptional regulator [Phycicoccus sp.]